MAVIGKIAIARHFRFPARFFIKNNRAFSVFATKAKNHNITSYKPNFYCVSRHIFNKIQFVNSESKAMGALSPMDPSSYSRPELAVIEHVNLEFNIDFEKHVLHGIAVLNFKVLQDIDEVILDASNLTIESIQLEDGTSLKYTVDDPIPNYGSKLLITLADTARIGQTSELRNEDAERVLKDVSSDSKVSVARIDSISSMCGGLKQINFSEEIVNENDDIEKIFSYCICVKQIYSNSEEGLKIKIKYSTSPTATALQWLEPNQTSGKKHPYLFSQCQPIHARSILPCQDTPAVKFTYEAEVTAPEEFTVLMSAIRGESRSTKTMFRQPVPIPSYLLAIAVAVLESRELGPRSHVWSEKAEIEQSAWEFAETEKYLQAAEKLCGPYQWTQYDLLVLPPSFPYGGMENPCLTFVTPTLLAGDRSQADVIVHEIMHSWTGNLVTNRNFEHFWLNEGFTVFLERKVGASLINDTAEAKRSRDFHSLLGLQELSETIISNLGVTNPLTRLVPELNGVHPDDAFSRVPYEKGSLFLRYLEDLVGGPEIFDDFLRSYLNNFQKRSLDTDQFKAYLLNYFKDSDKLQNVDWNTWLYKSGMPPIIPQYDTSMTKTVTALLTKIAQEDHIFSYDDVKALTPHQLINLLQDLIDRDPLPLDRIRSLGEAYKLTGSKNSEIVYRWLRLCIRSRDDTKLSDVFAFVNSQGRMKYVRPIYRDLYAWEDVRSQAIENFLKNEPYMMHVSAYTLRKDLHLSE